MAQIFAHRGAVKVAPENTLPAFEKALEMGVDGIELDVQTSADGVPVVMHDFTVERTTGGSGAVAELTHEQLQKLDARGEFGYVHLWTRIPTLMAVFDLVGDRCTINIEIKSKDLEGGDVVNCVADLVRARDLYDQVIISSFNPVSLIKMRYIDPEIKLGLLFAQPVPAHLWRAWMSPVMAPQALHPIYGLVDEVYMKLAGELSKSVNTWTVNDVAEARRLDELGVDAIITDVPDVIAAALKGG